MWSHPFGVMTGRHRQAKLEKLLHELEIWERVGRDLLCQVVELSNPGDEVHLEALRVLELLNR